MQTLRITYEMQTYREKLAAYIARMEDKPIAWMEVESG